MAVDGGVRAELEQFLNEQLTPLRGRFKEVGIYLTAPDGIEVVDGASLLDPAALRARIAAFGERIGTDDLRIAGVHWIGQLGYALLPPIEIAMTRAGIGLDASLGNIGIVQPDGQPAQILIRNLDETVVLPERYSGSLPVAAFGRPLGTAEELRTFVLDRLFGQTFRPLIELIHALTNVSLQVIWGQAAYEADLFFGQLARVAPEEANADFHADRATFFARREWPVAPGPNPLYGPTKTIPVLDKESGEPTTRTLRSTCCLIYQVPTGRMCGACPLAPKRDTVAAKRATVGERRAAMQAGD
jgi:hypothetical protein